MSTQAYRYAGLQRVKQTGLSVAEASRRLVRFSYVEQRLMRLLASRIVSIPERDIKVLLARLQYEDALHSESWRQRVSELRTNRSKLNSTPDPTLEILFDEAEHIPGTYAFLYVVTTLLKSSLLQAYHAYEDTTNNLADYPTMRILRSLTLEEQEHHALLTLALADLTPSTEEEERAQEWTTHLQTYLTAAGGIDGTASQSEAPPRKFSETPYHIPRELKRDNVIPRVWDFEKPALEDVQNHLNYMMAIRLSEINVAEGLAIVMVETPSMPWSFYLDIARHCWDEMRHSLFGEAAIENTYADRGALPMRDYEGVYAMEAPTLEQYAVLGLEIEGQNMKYPPGKRQEWEFARDYAKDPLMTTLQDFDWADEVLHVNIARRQLDTWFDGGLKAISPFSKGGKEHRTAVKQRQSATRVEAKIP